ncbi:metal-dependent hydrolase [Tundrisphaera lichenicola]|uniref:metal-dependent hydrolase n=1 Tax=Tundrisphaera lichenicola TaxID=2029860 RepID=UPI003EBB75DD
MATRVQWLGHSCLLIESDGKRILIDPFLDGNPKAAAKPEDVQADVILVSHGHEDHLGDTLAIARRTGATVVANYELGNWLKEQGLTEVHGMQHGGGCQVTPTIHVRLTVAFHGSTLPGGGYGGNPCGFLITLADGSRIYDAADTALFGDMKLIGEEGLDLAILPIGDYYTMGPADAIRAVNLLQPKAVLPIHYNTFPPIQQDAHAWAEQVNEKTSTRAVVPEPGGWVEVR